MGKTFPIFLDNNATTPRDPRVLKVYNETDNTFFGNSSSNHIFGWQAAEIIQLAREKISSAINCDPNLIIFTSGASESNNLAIRGYLANTKKRFNIITSKLEHSSIFETVESLKEIHTVLYTGHSEEGYTDFLHNLPAKDALITTHHVNNEVGTIQDITSLNIDDNTFIHLDCAQSIGKIKLDLEKLDIDCISISSHKTYGPAGIGALIFKSQSSMDKIKPQITGGNQQQIRAGTLPTALIAAFGEAMKIAFDDFGKNTAHINELTNLLYQELNLKIKNLELIGEKKLEKRVPGNLSLFIPNIKADRLISKLSTKVAISKGSACISNNSNSSRILDALGYPEEISSNIIRIGVGKFNTKEDILSASEIISQTIKGLS